MSVIKLDIEPHKRVFIFGAFDMSSVRLVIYGFPDKRCGTNLNRNSLSGIKFPKAKWKIFFPTLLEKS